MSLVTCFLEQHFIRKPKLRRFVTRLLYGNRDLDIEILGTRIRINTIKENGYFRAARLARTRGLLRDEVSVLLNLSCLFSNGDTFVDVGANVGIYCLTFARFRLFYADTRFYAFEANPDTYSRLAPNAKALGVVAYNLAISDFDGVLEFVGGAVSHVFTTVENRSSYSLPEAPIVIQCRRLDRMDLNGGSIILKIDVEGQELRVLNGAQRLFDAGRIKAVYLDGYARKKEVEAFLLNQGLSLREGRSLDATTGSVFSLLALRP